MKPEMDPVGRVKKQITKGSKRTFRNRKAVALFRENQVQAPRPLLTAGRFSDKLF